MSIFNEGELFDGAGPAIPASIPPSPPAGYLGRFQVGQTIPIAVAPLDDAGFPVAPDAAPLATISDSSGNTVEVIKLAMIGDAEHFGVAYFVGLALSLGTYLIAYSYSVAGTPGTLAGSFDVIPGGDAGGKVISLYAYDRPESRYVVTQLSSGMIVQGRNPRL